MMPRHFQSLCILVVVLVFVSAAPQTYVRYNHNYGVLTLPPELTHRQAFNTVDPVTKPMTTTVTPSNTDMQASAPESPTASNPRSIPSGGAASATEQKPSASLATPSRRMKKTSVTGVPISTEEKSKARPRAMTLPR